MVSSGLPVNREKRVTEVFLVHRDHTVPKETMVFQVLQGHLVPLVLPDYPVPLVPKEPKGRRVKLDRRERPVPPDPRGPLAPPAMSSTRSP